jgi:hypothetical protein
MEVMLLPIACLLKTKQRQQETAARRRALAEANGMP